MTCTCPDVAYALGVTSRYQANPGEEYWKVVKTILKYLRRTKDQFLIYGDFELKLEEGEVPLLCDNTEAIAQAKEPRSHQKSKQVLRRNHLIREIIERGDVEIQRVDGKENAADSFTKALGAKEFDKHK
uniref:Uncharacterized protein LOC104241506 n=1 Tax=Nicotiana sylvestris TaxID=4096 RepID=A0A1U7XYP1_NICSY|nr:PREDICTED: uncharacterized protein LOC104241506 [Nicotiana sylvestris]